MNPRRKPPIKQAGNAQDRLQRLFAIIEVLQTQRKHASVAELLAVLRANGQSLIKRTLERDLRQLEALLGDRIDYLPGFGWRWNPGLIDPLRLTPQRRDLWLTLALVEHHLEPVLPSALFEQLDPLFAQARAHLQQSIATTYRRWRDCVGHAHGLQMLAKPDADPAVIRCVQQALMDQTVLQVRYAKGEPHSSAPDLQVRYAKGEPHSSAPELLCIVPLALVLDDGALYVVAQRLQPPTARGPLVYAVHRMVEATHTGEQAPASPEFQLNRFLEDRHAFRFPIDSEAAPMKLLLRIVPGAARIFRERQLAPDQSIEAQADGSLLLRARVVDSLRLHWFLLSYGDGVEVLEPPELREHLRDLLERALEPYLED